MRFRKQNTALGVAVTGLVVLLAASALQLAFVGSYVGAFHDPLPHSVPVDLLAPYTIAPRLTAQLGALPGKPVEIHAAASSAAARADIESRRVYAYFEPHSKGPDTLAVATAANRATALALESVFAGVEASRHRPAPRVVDLAPLPANDPAGLSGFYAVVAWMIGGYLGATLLGLVGETRARSRARALARVLALAVYAVASGVLSVVLLDKGIGVLGGHFVDLCGIAALSIFAAGAATAGLQSLLGMAGTGVAILIFVVLGNPSSGGPYARDMLPQFWRVIGGYLPPGAAVDLVRNVLYFGARDIQTPVIVLGAWAVAGAIIALALGGRRVSEAAAEGEAAAGFAAA
ncbi:MAG TPA: hypothetical protein VG165_10705 [Solirubrobacteraceae bacterium]|nr:hypothetical protein [Solirubrobacteraceae bacterium]